MRPYPLLLWLALCAIPAAATPALAQESAEAGARARELRLQGHAHFDERRYAEALASYRASYALSGDPALLYNIGRAHQFLNEAPEALSSFEEFAAKAPAEIKAKVQGFDQTMAEVRARVATLTLSVNVPGARVLVRKKEVGKTPLKPLRLMAGEAEVELLAEGYEPLIKTILLPAGGASSVDLLMTPKPRTSAPPPRPEEPRPRPAPPTRWWLWAGLGVVLVGGALTVALLTEKSPTPGSLGTVTAPLVRF